MASNSLILSSYGLILGILFINLGLIAANAIGQQEEITTSKKRNERLLLVNILNRHGDRAPTGITKPYDRHGLKIKDFWPRG